MIASCVFVFLKAYLTRFSQILSDTDSDVKIKDQFFSVNVRVRKKLFRNSSGFRFDVSFVDCTSVFVKSVLETSLSFTYIL